MDAENIETGKYYWVDIGHDKYKCCVLEKLTDGTCLVKASISWLYKSNYIIECKNVVCQTSKPGFLSKY